MTDRVNGLSVTLERDMRIDDVESLVAAIRHLRGVVDVQPSIVTTDAYYAESRARQDIAQQLHEFARQVATPPGDDRR